MKEKTAIGVTSVIFAAVGAYFHELIGPAVVLAIVMASDWFTGLAEAWVNGGMCSRTGIIGIIKKLSYIFIVCVAVVVDIIIQAAAAKTGINLGGFYMFGLLVTVWLIFNECISILENVAEIGAPLPPFLVKLIGKLKKTTEEKGEDLVE